MADKRLRLMDLDELEAARARWQEEIEVAKENIVLLEGLRDRVVREIAWRREVNG